MTDSPTLEPLTHVPVHEDGTIVWSQAGTTTALADLDPRYSLMAVYGEEAARRIEELEGVLSTLNGHYLDLMRVIEARALKAERERDEAVKALEVAAARFIVYAEMHRAKGADDKAARNQGYADDIRSTLLSIKGG